MKFFAALRIADYAMQFSKALGLDINALVAAGDPVGTAKAQQAKMQPSADAAAIIAKVADLEIEIAALTTALESAKEEVAEAQATAKTATDARVLIETNATTFTSALAAGGLKCDINLSTAVDAAAITTAASSAISLKGRELLAKHGIKEPVATVPDADPAKSGKKEKSVTWSEYQAMSPGEKMRHFRSGGTLSTSPV